MVSRSKMVSIYVSNIPSSCEKEDLKTHFSQTRHGGGPIDYILHPLGLKHTKALVAYKDSNVLHEVLMKEHEVFGTKLKVSAIPTQMYSWVSACIDPVVVSGISNVTRYVRSLEEGYGVKIRQSSHSSSLYVEGTLIQVQCVQQALETRHRENLQQQQQELMKIGQPDSMMPRDSADDLGLAPSGKTRKQHSPLEVEDKVKDDEFIQQSMPAMHVKDQLYPLREEEQHKHAAASSSTSKSGGTATTTTTKSKEKSPYKKDDDEVEDMFASSYSRGGQRQSTDELYRAATTRQPVPRYADDAHAYQSMPVTRQYDHDRHDRDLDRDLGDNDDMMQTAPKSRYLPKSRREVTEPTHKSTKEKPRKTRSREKSAEASTEALDPGIVAYLWKIYGMQLAYVQSKLNVDFDVVKVDDFVQVKITPTPESSATCSQRTLDEALAQLVTLYQTVWQDVVREPVVYDKDEFTRKEADYAVESTKQAFATSVHIDTETHGEVAVIGDTAYAPLAAKWVLKNLKAARYRAQKHTTTAPYAENYGEGSYYDDQDLSATAPYDYRQARPGYGAVGTTAPRSQRYPGTQYDDEFGLQGTGSGPATWHGESDPPVAVKKDFPVEQTQKPTEKLYSRLGTKKTTKKTTRPLVHAADDLEEDSPDVPQGHDQDLGDWGSEFAALNFSIGRDPKLKVSMYAGDLTKVEVDAIVNPAVMVTLR